MKLSAAQYRALDDILRSGETTAHPKTLRSLWERHRLIVAKPWPTKPSWEVTTRGLEALLDDAFADVEADALVAHGVSNDPRGHPVTCQRRCCR